MSSRIQLYQTVRRAIPGAVSFSRLHPLILDVKRAVRSLRIHHEQRDALIIRELQLLSSETFIPHSAKATMSSRADDRNGDPYGAFEGRMVMTANELAPWWQIEFRKVLPLDRIVFSGWPHTVLFEAVDELGQTTTYDFLQEDSVNERLSNLRSEMAALLHAVQEGVWSRAMVGVSHTLSLMISAIDKSGANWRHIPESFAQMREDFLGVLCGYASSNILPEPVRNRVYPVVEKLVWKDRVSGEDSSPQEYKAAALLMAMIVAERGAADMNAVLSFGKFLDSRNKLLPFEDAMNKFFSNLEGDPRITPILLSKHGFLGSVLRQMEDSYVEATREIVDVLARWQFPAAICYGTLLGIVREGRLLAHDDDVDVIFLCEGAKSRRAACEAVIEMAKVEGFEFQYEKGFEFIKLRSRRTGLWVDGFPAVRTEGGQVELLMEKMMPRNIDSHILTPFSQVDYYGQPIAAPAKPKEFLAERYGSDWMVPKRLYEIDWIKDE